MTKSNAPVFRSLAAMHRAGISWPKALESAAGGDPRFGQAQRALERGEPLGRALASVVDPLDIALIEAGETDGSLERVLAEIANTHEEAARQRGEEWTALLYPVIVAHIGALLLPLPDLMQGNIGGALFWMALILVPTWGFLFWRRRQAQASRPTPGSGEPPAPRPAIGPWLNLVEGADARALDALGRLYEAGVPVAESLDLAIAAGWGGRVAVDLAEARRRVARGQDLSGAWRLLPAQMAARLKSAEESGSLGGALSKVADELRFGIRMRRKRVAALIPVIATLVIGGIVAWRMFTVVGRMYSGLGR